jgi:flagellar protein FlgJ
MTSRIVEQAGVYTDLNAVQKLRSSSIDKDEALRATSRQFESFMTSMMIKSMRQVNAVFEKGNPFHDNASTIYRDMLDQQMSLNLSGKQGMGLADMLARQLGAKDSDSAVALTETEKTALDRVARHRTGRPLLATMIPGPVRPIANGHGETGVSAADSMQKPFVAGVENPARGRMAPVIEQLTPASDQVVQGNDQPTPVAPDSFATPEAFIDAVFPAAARVAGELGVDPALLVAQSALETGWGRHMIREPGGEPSNNLFGIKADKRWQGEVATVTTTEYRDGRAVKEVAPFRSYSSYEESFSDYLQFIKSQPRYESALATAGDPAGYAQALQQAGYATDPAYASKVTQIFNSDALQKARIDWMSRADESGGQSL